MKRIFSLGLLALTGLLATEQQAPAWVNFKFSAGLNWHWQSGNNMLFWGAWKDGQAPGPEMFGTHGYPNGHAQPFLYQSSAPPLAPNGTHPASVPTPVPGNNATQQAQGAVPGWQYQNVFQPASYNPYYFNHQYYTPNYYGTSYPSYWYGR